MPPGWFCLGCRTKNLPDVTVCASCGLPRPKQPTSEKETHRVCMFEGAALEADGYCQAGGGYPMTEPAQPFVCSRCRRRLPWNGACYCTPLGEMAEGDHYELQGSHFRKTSGPQRVFTAEQNMAAAKVVQRVLDKLITEAQGQDEIKRIAAQGPEEVPF